MYMLSAGVPELFVQVISGNRNIGHSKSIEFIFFYFCYD